MNKAVIDTNILVSALLSPGGKPSQVMQMVFDGRIFPVVSKAVLEEYQGVLSRKKFGFSAADLNAFLFLWEKMFLNVLIRPGFMTMCRKMILFLYKRLFRAARIL